MSSTEPDEGKSLATFALFMSMDVISAVQAAIVTQAAALYFHQHRDLFACNPANTFPYVATAALEERSVVRVAEHLKNEHKLLPTSVEVRRKAQLINHRDALSHTLVLRWRRPAMQEFFDADRHWTDRRAALVWDMWRSVNESLRELHQAPRDETVPVGWHHAATLHAILRLSMKPEHWSAIPDENALTGVLQKFRDDFLDLLVKRPDGT